MIKLSIWDLVLIDGNGSSWFYVTNDENFDGKVTVDRAVRDEFEVIVKKGDMTTDKWKQLLWASGDFKTYTPEGKDFYVLPKDK